MIQFARLAPPNSIVFIEDASGGKLPEWNGSRFGVTESCIMMPTLCAIDGETEFRLGARDDVDPGTMPTFQGRLKTPSGKIVIRRVPADIAVPDNIIVEIQVPQPEVTIYIWTNHSTEPDQIIVGFE